MPILSDSVLTSSQIVRSWLSIMSHNTWIHQIARVLVQPLVSSSVTPNHITTLRLLTGIAAAGAAAIGRESWRQVAAVLFFVSIILDRTDGELARLSDQSSTFGHKYDLLSDTLVNALIFIGLGIGLRNSILGLWAVPMGIVAGLSVTAILEVVMRTESTAGIRAAELGSVAGFDPDDGMLAVPILIWAGLAVLLLSLATVCTPLFAAFFLWRFRRYFMRHSSSNSRS